MSRLSPPVLALLLGACVVPEDPKREPEVVRGLPGTGDDTGAATDSAETGAETGLESGAPETGGAETGGAETGGAETGGGEESGEAAVEVCYPGLEWGWDACFPLVEADPSWGEDYAYPEPYGGDPQYSAPARFLDLATIEAGADVAPNFVLDEFASAEKGRYAVVQSHLVEYLQYIREESGGPLTVNSGYRNVTYNAGVGGVSSSRHIYGDAADLASSVYDLEELAEACETWGADYTQVYESHVHCDWRDEPLDPAFYDLAEARPAPPSPPPALHAALRRSAGAWSAPASGFDEGEPYRRWRALDADGAVIAEESGRSFEAPAGAARVEVVVGGRLRLAVEVDDAGPRL